jgi:hypothetical protein
MTLLNERVLTQPPIPQNENYWNAVRQRLRAMKPPSLDE